MDNRTDQWLNRHLGAPERRWPVLAALFGIAGLYAALPPALLPFPDRRIGWIPFLVVLGLSVPLVWTGKHRRHRTNAVLAYGILSLLTVFMMVSLGLLIRALPTRSESPAELLRSAAALWVTNVLIFACWYWRLDAGGPNSRAAAARHENGAFLFPQMTMTDAMLHQMGQRDWKPGFVDYLFLAFNSSTALSPADTPVLSRWAKVLMMLQAAISFTIIILLAARAVNIL